MPDRRVTAILYLNEGWQPAHGGALHIDNKHGARWEVQPQLGRMVFFTSHLMHEVRPAYKPRSAITGWYYGSDPIDEKLLLYSSNVADARAPSGAAVAAAGCGGDTGETHT